jgi:hypothetical protein
LRFGVYADANANAALENTNNLLEIFTPDALMLSGFIANFSCGNVLFISRERKNCKNLSLEIKIDSFI